MKAKIKGLLFITILCVGVFCFSHYMSAAGGDSALVMVNGSTPEGGIAGIPEERNYDILYYGNNGQGNPLRWLVLDNASNTGEAGNLFLLSEGLMGSGTNGDVYYDSSEISNNWQSSMARMWCMLFAADRFSSLEQSAMMEVSKSDPAHTVTLDGVQLVYPSVEGALSGDKVFFLSASEASEASYGLGDSGSRIVNYGDGYGLWWLRSPAEGDRTLAGMINGHGNLTREVVNNSWAARPAMNIGMDKVLFTSWAVGGKVSQVGPEGVTSIPRGEAREWKLTLLDSQRSFSASYTPSGDAVAQGELIDISYQGALVGDREYISVLIFDKDGEQPICYGRILQTQTEVGTAQLCIPTELGDGEYDLYVFNEQYNGDGYTDYASAFSKIGVTVSESAKKPDPAVEANPKELVFADLIVGISPEALSLELYNPAKQESVLQLTEPQYYQVTYADGTPIPQEGIIISPESTIQLLVTPVQEVLSVEGEYEEDLSFTGLSGEGVTVSTSLKVIAAQEKEVVLTIQTAENTDIPEGSVAFAAMLGEESVQVIWSVSGATSTDTLINESGILTIGQDEEATSLTITAVSADDSSMSAQFIWSLGEEEAPRDGELEATEDEAETEDSSEGTVSEEASKDGETSKDEVNSLSEENKNKEEQPTEQQTQEEPSTEQPTQEETSTEQPIQEEPPAEQPAQEPSVQEQPAEQPAAQPVQDDPQDSV